MFINFTWIAKNFFKINSNIFLICTEFFVNCYCQNFPKIFSLSLLCKAEGRCKIKVNLNSVGDVTGDLLLKEQAVVSCLYLNEVYDYCSCCLIRTYVLIPCFQCSKALFCSKYCLTKAMEQYHHVECPLMEYFADLEPEDQHVQYITRLVCFLSNQVTELTNHGNNLDFSCMFHFAYLSIFQIFSSFKIKIIKISC